MLKQLTMAALCATTMLASTAQAHTTKLADDHAPIGVMGDHHHKQGEWMTAYRYNTMTMQDTYVNSDKISTSQALNAFMMTPTEMNMEMHMVGGMYGVTDKLTVTGMIPYIDKSMTMQNRMGAISKSSTEGIGDIKLAGLYSLYESDIDAQTKRITHSLLLNFGTSLPTGSITERNNAGQKLAYGMQLGSGTADPFLRLTYINKYADWSWGTQAGSVIRIGKNNEGYRLGNEYTATSWAAYNIKPFASVSFRLDGKLWEDIHGQDNELNPMMSASARTDLRAGRRVDALVGLNLYETEGKFAGHRLAIEYGLPVYQRLDSYQLGAEHRLTLGWQWAF